jgi:hypothetical protein
VQAVAFGKDLTLVALGGEVVVDYDLRIKKEFGGKGLIVADYSNDVMAYIPSKRVLGEGGYEPDFSMIYYGQPGPWRDDVEDRIMGAVRQVMQRVGRGRPLTQRHRDTEKNGESKTSGRLPAAGRTLRPLTPNRRASYERMEVKRNKISGLSLCLCASVLKGTGADGRGVA